MMSKDASNGRDASKSRDACKKREAWTRTLSNRLEG